MTVARNLWGHIERRDHRVMRRMNRWRAPRWIRVLDDRGNAHGRRLAVVRAGRDGADLRRRRSVTRRWQPRVPPGSAGVLVFKVIKR